MLDARYSHLYFYHSLNRLQRGLSAIAELLVIILYTVNHKTCHVVFDYSGTLTIILIQRFLRLFTSKMGVHFSRAASNSSAD